MASHRHIPTERVMLTLAILVVLVGAVYALPSPTPDSLSALAEQEPLPLDLAGPENDRRLKAFLQAYDPLIDSMVFEGDEALFFLGSSSVYFQDGRMLAEEHLGDPDRFDPIFYRYALDPLTEPPPSTGNPVYSTDLLESLFGRTETEIRGHGKSVSFLGHGVFVNTVSLEPLRAVEADLLAAAESDPSLERWISDLDVAYSFIDREISGSGSRSYHSWGLAVDLVPRSYRGKHVYWRWSRVFNRDAWHRIPLSRRWSPPQAVIEAFERHGFVWGGKWSHFDTIHFEFRPEIVEYNRMIEDARAVQATR
jgi:D-alanyl-D-alanine carboxypeptidase